MDLVVPVEGLLAHAPRARNLTLNDIPRFFIFALGAEPFDQFAAACRHVEHIGREMNKNVKKKLGYKSWV